MHIQEERSALLMTSLKQWWYDTRSASASLVTVPLQHQRRAAWFVFTLGSRRARMKRVGPEGFPILHWLAVCMESGVAKPASLGKL